jgi:hypothetical protein
MRLLTQITFKRAGSGVLPSFLFSILLVSNLVPATTGLAFRGAFEDGPIAVNLGDVYKKGDVKIESYDLQSMPPLPVGYAALNNKGHLITTTAMASGPYTIHFKADSISDEATFKKLRIFHAEPDFFDPDAPVWVDRTGDSSRAPAPNFSNRSLDSYSEELGVFVIGKLVQGSPPATGTADLIITSSGSPESVTAPNLATFTVKVLNRA